MERDGFIKKDFDELADVYVINTCSVTDNADKECRQLVRKIQRKAPDSMVTVRLGRWLLQRWPGFARRIGFT